MSASSIDTKNLRKNFIWNTIGSGLNSFTSVFFLLIATRINGLNDAGIFSLGFSLATMFFYIGIYNGRVYQVTDNSKITDHSFFNAKIISVSLMIIISLLYLLTKSYDPFKFTIIFTLCFYKALEAFSDVLYGIFQKYGDLYISGISYTIKSILCLATFLMIDNLTNNLLISILAMILTNILVLIFYDFLKLKKYKIFKSKAHKKDIIQIFKIGFFPFALAFLSLVVFNAPKYAIDDFLTNDFQTYFGIIVMPANIVTLLAQFIIYPFLTTISDYIKQHKIQKLTKLINKINLSVLGIGSFCTLCAFLVGIPVLSFIYGVDLTDFRLLLTIIMIGATLNACVYILSNTLISLRKFKAQTLIYLSIAVFSIFLARSLVQDYSIDGACYEYLISMVMLFASFLVITKYITSQLEKENAKSTA